MPLLAIFFDDFAFWGVENEEHTLGNIFQPPKRNLAKKKENGYRLPFFAVRDVTRFGSSATETGFF